MKQRGFSLLEIMVVVAIMGVLLSIVIPNFAGQTDEAKTTAARADLSAIAQALEFYRVDNDHYPTTLQGLEALVNRPTDRPVPTNWRQGGYLRKLPTDPWGNAYVYLFNDREDRFELYSLGRDGRDGGEGVDSDVWLDN